MFKYKMIALVLLTAIFTSSQAYCQQDAQEQQVKSIAGQVIGVDVEGWVVHLNTEVGKMDFYLGPESDLNRFTHHMASVEIEVGDMVTIHYIHSLGKNNIIKLVDRTPSKF